MLVPENRDTVRLPFEAPACRPDRVDTARLDWLIGPTRLGSDWLIKPHPAGRDANGRHREVGGEEKLVGSALVIGQGNDGQIGPVARFRCLSLINAQPLGGSDR